MKLKCALIFSVCVLSTGGIPVSGYAAAKIASGEVTSSREELLSQLTQQKDKVKTLEAEIAKLRETIDALRSLAYGPADPSPDIEAPNGKKHVIAEGETVSQIASQHGITRKKLMEVNGISENQQMYIGDELLIPAAPETQQPELVLAEAASVKPVSESSPSPMPESTPAPMPESSPTVMPESSPAPVSEKMTTIAWNQAENEEPETSPAPLAASPKPNENAIEAPKADLDILVKTTPALDPEIIETPAPAPVLEEENQQAPAPQLQASKSLSTETDEVKKGFTYYTIKFGDNLGKIAKNHGISIGALMSFNGIKNPDKISGGQKLKIPSKEEAKSLSKIRPSNTPLVASVNGKPLPSDAYGIYTVQTGDTLYDLARDFFTTEKEIQDLNKMGDKTNIVPGQDLIVPMAEYSKKNNLVSSTESH